MSYSDNAIMTKVRARYGKRLRQEDYKQLMVCRSVAEIAHYLKNSTVYTDVLSQANDETIHRGQLEELIRRRVLNIYMSLLKYSYDDRLFLNMYIRQNEISQLLLAMRLLNANAMDRYIVSLPVYLARFMSFDLFGLAKIQDFDGLLALLEHSGYYDIVGYFRPYASGQIDIVGCERALLTHYYESVFEDVQRDYSGKTRDNLIEILRWQIGFYNINTIYRLKRYFNYTPERIRKVILPLPGSLSSAVLGSLINAESAGEMLRRMKEVRSLSGLAPEGDSVAVSMITHIDRERLRLAQKPFRFSNRPVVVVASYMTILEIELANLVHIIEGVRYGLSPEELSKLLVILH